MGAKNSKPADVVILPNAPTGFNVTVTKDGKQLVGIAGPDSIEDRILKSFEAGKQEGISSIHRSLDSVAAQVYDNVHEQLVGMQVQQLKKVEELVSELFYQVKVDQC